MNELEKLTLQEKELLYKGPAYVSLLAANTVNADGKIDDDEKKAALELSHINTFSVFLY